MTGPPSVISFTQGHAAALGRFAGLAGVLVLFSALEPEVFLSWHNMRTVATQTVIVGIAAMGATMVIISGGIDLSVGSVIAFASVVTVMGLNLPVPPVVAAMGGVAAGGLCGLASGVLITTLGVVPFIATLGMMSITRGLAKLLVQGQPVAPDDFTWLEDVMMATPPAKWMLFSPGVWLLVVVAAGVTVLLSRTVFGRHIFAVGSNEATARLCGLPVRRIKIMIYTLAGLLSGLSGVLLFSRLTIGDPTAAIGQELDVIAAVVIGGGSLSGGEGSISGALVGAFILQFLRNGCNLVGVDNFIQEIIIGTIVVGAVAVDQARKRLGASAA